MQSLTVQRYIHYLEKHFRAYRILSAHLVKNINTKQPYHNLERLCYH